MRKSNIFTRAAVVVKRKISQPTMLPQAPISQATITRKESIEKAKESKLVTKYLHVQ